jgi:clan AA aspartic protease
MIQGTVVAYQGRIPIRARGQDGEFKSIEAIVDSGFDGWLSLPFVLITALGLRWKTKGQGVLADGTESEFDVFDGVILWHGRPRRVSVVSMSTVPLIGMALLEGNELNMKVWQGGAVTIKPLRRRRPIR